MRPDLLTSDLERKPDALRGLARSLRADDAWSGSGIVPATHLVLLGMGSSHYANSVAAARLRSRGVNAVAEIASSDVLPAPRPETVVVAVSASGGSVETLDAVSRYAGTSPVVAVTNTDGSAVTSGAAHVVPMLAEAEESGVACRSFQHTLALLMALEQSLLGGPDVPSLVERAAIASADLIERRDAWMPQLTELAIGPLGTYFAAPARRLSSAQQSALMLRETPRLPAVGCEVGDWSHVDVYLTKSTDYRLVLYPGSPWEPALLRWVAERGSTLITVGAHVAGSSLDVRYLGDEDDDVRLLSEVLVAELLAASVWAPDTHA